MSVCGLYMMKLNDYESAMTQKSDGIHLSPLLVLWSKDLGREMLRKENAQTQISQPSLTGSPQ